MHSIIHDCDKYQRTVVEESFVRMRAELYTSPDEKRLNFLSLRVWETKCEPSMSVPIQLR